jgi:glycosyltransferase involved in cell wall biosynthesis
MRVAILAEQLFAKVPGGTGRYTADLLDALAGTRPDGCVVTTWTARHRRAGSGPGNTRTATAPAPAQSNSTGPAPGHGNSATAPAPAQSNSTGPAPGHGNSREPGAGPGDRHRQLALGRRTLSLAWSLGTGPAPSGASLVHAPTLLSPPRRDTPLVVTVHDDVPWSQPQTLTRYGAAWHRRIGARIAATADMVVTPTAAVAAGLLAVLPGLTADRILVAANPLPDARADRLRRPLDDEDHRIRRLKLPGWGYLLFVGTVEPRKGLAVLLAALRQSGGPRLPLLVVGPGGWGEVDLSSGAGRVRALGRLDDDDLAVAYRQATAVVLPSLAEGFGYPVVEAMCAGTPVVTSDDPALVETGATATLTAPRGDAAALAAVLRKVEDDPGLRRDLAERGRLRAATFGQATFGRTMWQLYAGL